MNRVALYVPAYRWTKIGSLEEVDDPPSSDIFSVPQVPAKPAKQTFVSDVPPMEELRERARARISDLVRGRVRPRRYYGDLTLAHDPRVPDIDTPSLEEVNKNKGILFLDRKLLEEADFHSKNVGDHAKARLEAYLDAMEESGVKPVSMTPEKQKSLLQSAHESENASLVPSRLKGMMNLLWRLANPKDYEKRMGDTEYPDTWTEENKVFRGANVQKAIEELTNVPNSPRERSEQIRRILREDQDLQKKLLVAGSRAVARSLATTPMGLAVSAFMTSPFWKDRVGRAILSRTTLSPEERANLSEEEQEKLLEERSPLYRQAFQPISRTHTSDIRAKDFFGMPFTGLFVPTIYGMIPEGIKDRYSLDEAFARAIGARRFFQGTTTDAAKNILRTGLDPGYGGDPSGFTYKATHQQGLRDEIMAIKDQIPYMDPDTKKALGNRLQSIAAGLGVALPEDSLKDPKRTIGLLQPFITLEGISSLEGSESVVRGRGVTRHLPEGAHLDLDASNFLNNARGNLFITTDYDVARRYGHRQNPQLVAEESRKLQSAIARYIKDGKGLSPSTFYEAYLQALQGINPSKDKPFVIGGAMPEEVFREKFMPDEDDVIQQGTAYRLKDENRVTPYAETGHYPKPGEKTPHGMEIPAESLNVGKPTFRQIWNARSKDWLNYVRGAGLDEDQRLLGLNKRFLSSAGIAGVNLGIKGAVGYTAFGPLLTKLYRRYKKKKEQAEGQVEVPERVTSEESPVLAEAEAPPKQLTESTSPGFSQSLGSLQI